MAGGDKVLKKLQKANVYKKNGTVNLYLKSRSMINISLGNWSLMKKQKTLSMTASSPVVCSGNSATFIFWPGFFRIEWAPSWHMLLQFHDFPWNYDVFLTMQNGLSLRLCTLCSPSHQCEEVGSFKLYRTKEKIQSPCCYNHFY